LELIGEERLDRLTSSVTGYQASKDNRYHIGQRRQMVRIWQFGSERLQRELDFQYSLLALFGSGVFSVPLFGTGLAAWLARSGAAGWAVVLPLSIVLWLCFAFAYLRQWNSYAATEKAAVEALRSIEATVPSSSD